MWLIDIAIIIQLFVLINPPSSFPVLMSAHKNKMNVRFIAINASLIALALAIVVALIGPSLFGVFGITVDSFRIAGGLVLLLLGVETIRSKEEGETKTKADSMVSVIATPLLTGPATISFIVIKTIELGKVDIISDILIAFILVALTFVVFSYTIKKINPKIVEISSRIFGLFLTAMAIELMFTGISNLIRLG